MFLTFLTFFETITKGNYLSVISKFVNWENILLFKSVIKDKELPFFSFTILKLELRRNFSENISE